MEHALIPTLVVITLLQLCEAQSPDAAPEWYAANDINDTRFSPKPITELFSTETSFSPQNPIVVLTQPTPPTSNRGVVSSPTPISQNSESTFSPNVIPLSSTESPPPPQLPNSSQPQQPTIQNGPPATQEQTNNQPSLLNQTELPPVNENPQNAPPNQSPTVNRIVPQQMQPPNLPFLAPLPMGNRIIIPGQQLPPNVGQPNYFVLYQQVPQTVQNMPPNGPQMPQQIVARPATMARNRPIVQQSPIPNQFFPQSNSVPRLNLPLNNIAPSPIPNSQQPTNQTAFVEQTSNQTVINQQPNPPFNQAPIYQQPNNPQLNNQFPFNQPPNSFPPNNQNPSNQIFQSSLPNNGPLLLSRPRQRNRVTAVRNNVRGRNQLQAPNTFPCPGSNETTLRTATGTKPQNAIITIRVNGARPTLQSHSNITTIWPTTAQAKRQASQMNSKNYDRCLNSCRDRKDRICSAPEKQTEINLESLKGFPSMCHMACHNTFRGNPVYEKVTDGRCGKLRTRIQTVDREKVRRDELKKSQYTIISNVPGTVVELAP